MRQRTPSTFAEGRAPNRGYSVAQLFCGHRPGSPARGPSPTFFLFVAPIVCIGDTMVVERIVKSTGYPHQIGRIEVSRAVGGASRRFHCPLCRTIKRSADSRQGGRSQVPPTVAKLVRQRPSFRQAKSQVSYRGAGKTSFRGPWSITHDTSNFPHVRLGDSATAASRGPTAADRVALRSWAEWRPRHDSEASAETGAIQSEFNSVQPCCRSRCPCCFEQFRDVVIQPTRACYQANRPRPI
jgi:hypothetical protein